MVLDHLSQRGHQQIAWMGILDRDAPYSVVFDALDESSAIDRQAFSVHGARHAAWANIAYCQLAGQRQPLILVERDWKRQTLEEVVGQGLDRILETRPAVTAVVCSADSVAAALLAAAKARGLRVPADLSIVSYGASEEVTKAEPAITSVEMPMELVGRAVPELIERRLADPAAVPISLQFQTTLFQGSSVATLNKDHDTRHP
jgi:DNA-binding LacI/PurR family transcriptional regulator